ncbi:MAG: FAD-dependent oxidoreductase [Burkholderiaceae bacterium]
MTEEKTVARRAFLKGGIGASIGAGLGVASLAAEAASPKARKATRTANYDTVVLGAGCAGLCCAIEAHDRGGKVVVLEKMGRPDGNTIYSSGRFAGVGSREQAGLNESVDAFVKDMMHLSHGFGDPDLLRAYAELSGPTIDWVKDLGVPLRLVKNLPAPSSSRCFFLSGPGITGGSVLIRQLLKAAEQRKIPVHYDTKAFDLITNERRHVTGVHAMTEAGPVDYLARGGVVLATGGFSANPELVNAYMGGWATRLAVRGSRTTTGENILMTKPLHALLVNMDQFYAGPIIPETHANPARIANSAYGIIISREGRRFLDENLEQAPRSRRIAQLTTDNRSFIIVDAKTDREDNILTKLLKKFARLNSPVYQANSIEELARAAGLPAETTVATVAEYNGAVASQSTAKLNPPISRKAPHALDTAPFYAIPMSGGIAATFGGPKIDTVARVIDFERRPIPGLYAAGNAAGGVWYDADIGGYQLGSAAVVGRLAARDSVARAQKA